MKGLPYFFNGATALAVAAFAAMIPFPPASAQDAAAKPNCTAPYELTRLDYTLKRTSQKIAAAQPIKIVAIGSSSTAGAGASSPEMSYPSRLQAELQALMPRVPVTVINRGVNGEESREMLIDV